MSKTALITGASSGIGAAYARQLAARGFDLILVARRELMLEGLATELREAHSVNAAVITADLADSDDVTRLERTIGLAPSLELLINNAGFGTQGNFANVDIGPQLAMVAVHIEATMRLCRAALPKMVARGRGAVINVSSIAGFLPLAGNATYASTKAYLTNFSRSLHEELNGTGVEIQALCPGFTYTEFHDSDEYGDFDRKQIPEWLWMTAEDVVTTSLAALGSGRVVVVPGFKNRLLVLSARSRPLSALVRFVRRRLLRRG